ncbi:hypothetical protein POVWA2_030570 [Plasmodium ovale wallikeri]|uniref:Uncharacterized protein n=1 Tax=Plasmodium ovale wallikeri TaxID=864142 RepID=A0A1A8YXF4_PLAOA|nr:hypothetical protein POVWA1_030900 [Plasmodium ovale wallikeri]SBT36491.1 hypothetical protein POVWA2_030570 [Plasmodium ovale wallikeri]
MTTGNKKKGDTSKTCQKEPRTHNAYAFKLRFSEKDDMARRVLKIMDSQLSKMYTRMRDGTVIPYMSFYLNDVIDKPAPNHQFIEQPLIKWTWDEAYDEAYEEN